MPGGAGGCLAEIGIFECLRRDLGAMNAEYPKEIEDCCEDAVHEINIDKIQEDEDKLAAWCEWL